MNAARRIRSGCATLALAALLVAVPATAASAHDRVVASTPSAGSVLTELPARFSLTTDRSLFVLAGATTGFAFDVRGPDGRYYGDGCIRIVDNVMSTAAAIGPAGAYTVRWQAVSSDGHPVSDGFAFTWQPPDTTPPATAPPSRGYASPQRCGRPAASSSGPATTAGSEGAGARVPLGDVLWIGGGVLVVLAAGAAVLFVSTRRPRPPTG
ncbi:MAG: copper resistance protein CopC [Micrococcales bacterium]|nr:copper resistance protein CopC [Micrococcales bacterium]